MNRKSVFVGLGAFLGNLSFAVIGAGAAELMLDSFPDWNQKPYTPADGSAVTRNPPPFIWVPPDDGLEYVLDVSPAVDFSRDVIHVADIPVSTIALTETLASGEWYWRYGVDQGEGNVVYSKTRRFTVPEGVRDLPYPDLDAAVRSVPAQHPRLFVLPDEVDSFRERARDGDLKALREQLARSCDKCLGEELVEEPPYVEGKGAERGKNYAHIFRTTRPPMDRMEQCALAYLITDDNVYGNEAKRRILHFFAWDPEGSTAYRHNDEPAMWVMMRGIRAYDWTYDLFSAEERAAVEPVMRARAAQFYSHLKDRRRFHTNPHESHAGRTLGFLGEVSLAFIHEWPEAREWLDYVLTLFWNVYPAWGRDDGGWHEGPGYWSAYMSFALHFVVPLKNATGVDLTLRPFFQNTPYYIFYSNPPYAQHSPFGDGEHGRASRGASYVMYAFSTLLQDPYLRGYAHACGVDDAGGILGVVLKDDTLQAKPAADLPQTRHFPGVGLVSLHTALGNAAEDVHFLFHSDPYGPISHAHADQNAFTLEAFGEALAICSGYYPWYGSDHHAKWQWESKSSNTITFDSGIGQKKRDHRSKGRILAFEPGDAFDYVCGDATAAYQGTLDRFVRHIVHVRPGVFVIMDDLAAPEPRAYEWRLHALSEMDVDQEQQRITVKQGDARLRVGFLGAEPLVLTQTSEFEFSPENGGADQFHAIASPQEKTAAMRYLTVLTPYRAGGENTLPSVAFLEAEGGIGVEIGEGSEKRLVAFKTDPDGDRIAFGPVEANATVTCAAFYGDGAVSEVISYE